MSARRGDTKRQATMRRGAFREAPPFQAFDSKSNHLLYHYTPHSNFDAKKAMRRSRCGEDLLDSLVGVHRAAAVFHSDSHEKTLDKRWSARASAPQAKQKPRPRIAGEA
jgi:hypothetical protein